jgi:undecaprenyl-diphosphatase
MHRGAERVPQADLIMGGHQWILLAIGFLVSFVVALGTVAWFMKWVRTRGFVPFALYRIFLGAIVLLWVAQKNG